MKGKEFSKDREFAVVLEKIHSDFKIIVEDLSSVKKKVEAIKIIVEDLSSVKKKVEAIFEEQGNQKEVASIIKTDLRIIKTDLAEIKIVLKDHAKRLSQLETVR